MQIYKDECIEAGLDIKQVQSIAMRISRALRDAHKLGIILFGGSGSGSLRFQDERAAELGSLIVADVDGFVDGGDGGSDIAEDGFYRGIDEVC